MPRDAVAPGLLTHQSTDFYAIEDLLEPEEIEIRDRVRAFCEKEVTPIVNDFWERAEFPFELVPKIAELGISGGTVQGYGSPGMSAVAAGLVAAEWARADGSVGTFYGVHSFLAMQSIAMLGSEEQRQRWLPEMARLEKIGAFGLTEPAHGSDAVGLETSARRDGDSYVLHGQKKWIGNGSIAGYQLVQDKLARMLAEITSMQLMCWRLSKLADAGRMTAAMASLAKMNHAAKARAIVADARDILGGDGILLDHHVARHHADMEAIFTFEGTDSVQALIVGREITGLSAISGRRPERP